MNFSEFKKLMTADPGNRDAETLRARHSAPEFEAAALEAEAFEEKLRAALFIPPPADLLAEIKTISQQPVQRQNWIPLALAAGLVIAVGIVGLVWKQAPHWDSVEAYVADHYAHDGSKLVAQAKEIVEKQDIVKIMTRLGINVDQQLAARIMYIKFCPTPEGRGAHMVVSTEQGPMTIIYMPKTRVTDGSMVSFAQQHALLVSLENGSAAIIGSQSQAVENLETILRNSFKSEIIGA